MPVSDAKEMILRTSAKEMLKHRPSWLKDCVRISVSAILRPERSCIEEL